MTRLIGKEDATEIGRLFASKLAGEVELWLFVSKKTDSNCEQSKRLLEEVASLNEKLHLHVFDVDAEPGRAKEMRADLAPTTIVMASNGARLYYVGTPGGRQLKSLVEDIIDASRGRAEMDRDALNTIRRVEAETVIKVFVTPFCAYSPSVVRVAHRFAIENPHVVAMMIETVEFPELVKRYNIVGVPRTVINERLVFDGAPSEKAFAEKVLEGSRLDAE
ncbi:MAG: thioredoxin family protein [Thaumarchaeota archaeon]|nr:thioredoxin family protein [Nitrososphaerota archaeon]